MKKVLKDEGLSVQEEKYWIWWVEICEENIIPLLNSHAKDTKLSDKIVCVCDYEKFDRRDSCIRHLFAIYGQVSIIDGGDINYNTLKEIVQRVANSHSNIVVIDHFDKIPNKTNCSLVDTFLLELLCSQRSISAIVLISTSKGFSFSNLPNCYKRK